MHSSSDPVPENVRVELKRLDQRWAHLPLDRALRHVGTVHAYALELAGLDPRRLAAQHPENDRGHGVATDALRSMEADGGAPLWAREVLGEPRPEMVMAQLAAVLFDVCAAGAAPPDVAARLVELRATLA